jgi:hypothetical protein
MPRLKRFISSNIGINLVVFFLYFVLTILLTFPLIKTLTTQIADPVDPVLNAWILHHNFEIFKSFDFGNYFNTNIFYPYKDTLLYSETLLSTSLLSFPIYLLTDNILLTYNLIVFFSFTFSAFTAYLLANYYLKNRWASFTVGIVFGFALFRFSHVGHLQTITTYFIPLTILYFEKLIKKPSKKYAILFAICFILMAHASLYHMVFTSIILGFIGLYRVITEKHYLSYKKYITPFLMAGSIIFIAVVPVYYKYYTFSKSNFVKRDIKENALYSADPLSILIAPYQNKLYGKSCATLEKISKTSLLCYEKNFFPGVTVVALCFVACLYKVGKNKKYFYIGITKHKNKLLFAFLIVTTFILGLGPYLKFLGSTSSIKMPYFYLYYIFPPAQGTRVPARMDIMFYLFLGLLAGFGVRRLLKSDLKKASKYILFGVINLFVILEYWSTPILSKPVFNYKAEAFQFLAKRDDIKVLVQLPMWVPMYGNLTDDSSALLASTVHKKALLNGYSGYNPEGHEILSDYLVHKFPAEDSIKVLKGLNTDAVVLAKSKKEYADKALFDSYKDLALIYEDTDYLIYKINGDKAPNGDINPQVMLQKANAGDKALEVKFNISTTTENIWFSDTPTPINQYVNIFINDEKVGKLGLKRPLYILTSKPYEKVLLQTLHEPLKANDKIVLKSLNGQSYQEYIVK